MNNVTKISIIILTMVLLTSCASNPPAQDPNYLAYQQAMLTQINKEQKPLIDLEIDSDGKIKGIKMYPERKIVQLLPFKPTPHPAWKVVNTAVNGVAAVFGIREGGKALERIINSSSGDTTYNDSYNTDESDHSLKDSYNPITDSNNPIDNTDNSLKDSYNPIDNTDNSLKDSYNPITDSNNPIDNTDNTNNSTN